MKKVLFVLIICIIFLSLFISCGMIDCGVMITEGSTLAECEHNWVRIANFNESTARDKCSKCDETRLYTDPESLPKKYEFEGAFFIAEFGDEIGNNGFYDKKFLEILNGGSWERDILAREFDYVIKLNDAELCYSCGEGVFANFGDNRQLTLNGADKEEVNGIIFDIFNCDLTVSIATEVTEEPTVTEETTSLEETETYKIEAENLMSGIVSGEAVVLDDLSSGSLCVADFALRLFKVANEDGRSTLVSPVSVLYALAMTANGAEGETRAEIESALGMSVEELNIYLYSYMASLPQGEKYKLDLANSIWITNRDSFTVKQSFLQKNADFYGADVYKAPFNEQTLKDINCWVSEKTNGLIRNALDSIPSNAVAYLINALIFDAEWSNTFSEASVYEGKFTKEDGTKKVIELMRSEESIYLEDENTTGFIKHYFGGKYAFAALLPNEGISVSDYVATLDGERLRELLSEKKSVVVYATMPKFETEYSVEMSEVLKEMGIVNAFDFQGADFSGLGTSDVGNIYLSRVIHKTYIEVGEQGTRAGAVTIFEAKDECAPISPTKTVTLDRPFVYMIIDCENNVPIFIGTMMGD